MSKKDYIALAKLLVEFRKQLDQTTIEPVPGYTSRSAQLLQAVTARQRATDTLDRDLIVPLAYMLKADNSAFDYSRFLAACGVKANVA